MIQNIVIGRPLFDLKYLLSHNDLDWKAEKEITLFTNERFLPYILKQMGIVSSTSEVKKNKP